MNRILILLGIVGVLIVAMLVVKRDAIFGDEQDKVKKSSSTAKKASTLPAIDKSLVRAIEVDDGKEKVRVERRGEKWVLPDAFDIPAMEDKSTKLFEALVDLDKATPVSSSPANHSKFEVDEGGKGKHLRLEGEGGKPIIDLIVGKMESGGGRTAANARTFVRLAGQNDVYLHGQRMAHLLQTMRRVWIDARLLQKEYPEINKMVETVTKMVIEYDDVDLGAVPMPGMPEVARSGERKRMVLECKKVPVAKTEQPSTGPEPTKPETPQAPVDERKWSIVEPAEAASIACYLPVVDGIPRQLLGGRFEDVKGTDATKPEFGLQKPVLEATLTFEDGVSRWIKLGAIVPPAEGSTPQPGASARYATVSDLPWVVTLPEYVARALQKKPDELKTPEANPMPPPGGPGVPGLPSGAPGEIRLPEGDKKDEPKKGG